MNSLKKKIPLYIFTFLLILPSLSSGNWTGLDIISEIGTNGENITIFGIDLHYNDLDQCTGNTPIVLPPSRAAYSEMYAMLVAAFLQGKEVELYINGCTPLYSGEYPGITAIRVLQ